MAFGERVGLHSTTAEETHLNPLGGPGSRATENFFISHGRLPCQIWSL